MDTPLNLLKSREDLATRRPSAVPCVLLIGRVIVTDVYVIKVFLQACFGGGLEATDAAGIEWPKAFQTDMSLSSMLPQCIFRSESLAAFGALMSLGNVIIGIVLSSH